MVWPLWTIDCQFVREINSYSMTQQSAPRYVPKRAEYRFSKQTADFVIHGSSVVSSHWEHQLAENTVRFL